MARGRKNIDDKIKASFEEARLKPPRDLWSGLSESLDNDALDAKLKASFEEPSLKAPDKVWSNVNQQLTIDKAWVRIRQKLNRITFFLWFRRAAIMFTVLFALLYLWPFSSLELRNPKEVQKERSEEMKVRPASKPEDELKSIIQDGQLPNPGAEQESFSHSSFPENELEQKALELKHIVHQEKEGQDSGILRPQTKANEEANYNPILAARESEDVAWIEIPQLSSGSWIPLYWSITQHSLRREGLALASSSSNRKEALSRRSWGLGIRLHYDRFNISNNLQRLARDANSLVAGQNDYGLNYEAYLQYHWSSNSSVELNYTWDELMEQSYYRFGEGLYLEESLEFRFQLISVLYQHRFNFPGKWIPHFELATGPYLGLLKSVRFNSPLGLENRSERYGNRYGMVLRIGQTLKAGDLNFSYGLQSQFSIANFHQGKEGLPATFDISHSARWGAYLGLAYRF